MWTPPCRAGECTAPFVVVVGRPVRTVPVVHRHPLTDRDVTRTPTRRALHALAAVTALAAAVVVVMVLRIGPVIAVVDAERGMGVHAGDLAALPLLVFAVLSLRCALAGRR